MRPFLLNNQRVEGLPDSARPVLAWLREGRGLTAAKAGCGEGDCGACAVLLGTLESGWGVRYRLVNACPLPLAALGGRHLVTLEGLNPPNDRLTPVQQALLEEGAIQCGFCTPGLAMGLTSWLLNGVSFDREEAWEALDGNFCRCTGYQGIKRAADRLLPLGAGFPLPPRNPTPVTASRTPFAAHRSTAAETPWRPGFWGSSRSRGCSGWPLLGGSLYALEAPN